MTLLMNPYDFSLPSFLGAGLETLSFLMVITIVAVHVTAKMHIDREIITQ